MDRPDDLSFLNAVVARDLGRIAWPAQPWVKPHTGPDGRPMANVLVIGAGQGGLTIAHALQRERVDGVVLIDRAEPAARGPWRTYARMKTLRSPKQTTGPDLDIPALTFQAWYEAQFGETGWAGLGKIPKEAWAAYLDWLRDTLGITVTGGTEARAIRPAPDHVAVDVAGPDGARTIHARHVVLATGIETSGRWWMPEFLARLPAGVRNHTCDAVDFDALKGRVVAVLGAGASAFDNAATALEAGAAEVHLFWRRPELQRVQPYKQISYAGFLRHLGDLDDARRWRIMRHLLTLREAFPAETWARVTANPNAVLHPGAGWKDAAMTPSGRVAVTTAQGPFECDHVIAGTGFDIDLGARPELAPFADRIACWADRYTPPEGEGDARLARYPYLGSTMEFLPRDPAESPAALARVRLFTFGATMSFGPSGSSINALKFSAPRLVSGITRALFTEDADAHAADLFAYATPEF